MNEPQFWPCPRCGRQIPSTSTFCQHCGFQLVSNTSGPAVTASPPLIHMPTLGDDLRTLPHVFRSYPRVWIPFAMIAIGFVLMLISPSLSADVQNYVFLYVQYFFFPQALFLYFIAGALAPRASYLIGFLAGFVTGLLWIVILVLGATIGGGLDIALDDLASSSIYVLVSSIILGTLAAGLAGLIRYVIVRAARPPEPYR